MHTRMRPLVLLAVFLTSSCAFNSPSNGTGQTSRVKISSNPALYNGMRIRLPLDDYFFDQDQMIDIEAAVDKLSGKCMQRLHQTWPGKIQKPSNMPWNSRRYGVTSLASARRYGYKAPLPEGVSAKEAADMDEKTENRFTHVTRRTISIYTGEHRDTITDLKVPVGGCRGEAYRKINLKGPDIDFQNQVIILQKRTWDDAKKSAPMVEAEKRWRDCMKEKGYSYKNPVEALEDPKWSASRQRPSSPKDRYKASKEEITTAIDDIGCKKMSLYAETWYSIEVQLQERAIQQNAAGLKEAAAKVKATLAKVYVEID